MKKRNLKRTLAIAAAVALAGAGEAWAGGGAPEEQ